MLLDISFSPKSYSIPGFILGETDHTLETFEFNVYSMGWMRDGNSIAPLGDPSSRQSCADYLHSCS